MNIIDIVKICFGILLVIIGSIGGILPIFQGWVFGLPGLIILSAYFPRVKKILNYIKKKTTNDDKLDD